MASIRNWVKDLAFWWYTVFIHAKFQDARKKVLSCSERAFERLLNIVIVEVSSVTTKA